MSSSSLGYAGCSSGAGVVGNAGSGASIIVLGGGGGGALDGGSNRKPNPAGGPKPGVGGIRPATSSIFREKLATGGGFCSILGR